nr:MAG TPA: hypothetical protein [Crassvirales sp.]
MVTSSNSSSYIISNRNIYSCFINILCTKPIKWVVPIKGINVWNFGILSCSNCKRVFN